MRILFQGDSITNAFRKPEEINPAYQLGSGYALMVAGKLGQAHPSRGIEFLNRGVSGHTVKDLLNRWEEDTLALRPDWLSLLVGVNDTIQTMRSHVGLTDAGFKEIYEQLLSSLIERKPSARCLLLEPFLVQTGTVTAEWKSHLARRQMIIREIAQAGGHLFVALQTRFDQALNLAPPEYWAFDGIHPTHAGFQLIADAWLETAQGPGGLRSQRSRVTSAERLVHFAAG